MMKLWTKTVKWENKYFFLFSEIDIVLDSFNI